MLIAEQSVKLSQLQHMLASFASNIHPMPPTQKAPDSVVANIRKPVLPLVVPYPALSLARS